MPAAGRNPTEARGLEDEYYGKRVIKIPGCPTHPDWVVGTIAHLMTHDEAPPLDLNGRPLEFFSKTVHSQCKYRTGWPDSTTLAEEGCLGGLGCRGPDTNADCPIRRWNSSGQGLPGVSWCVDAGSPCIGCTEPTFPGFAPFYYLDA
jgi:hydrogenase small subunit